MCCAAKDSKTSESKKEVTQFFTQNVQGEKKQYNSTRKLSLDQVKKARQRVWELWSSANEKLEEEKLIALLPLADKNSASWHLPPELEANALLPYYWGSKGAKPKAGYPLFVYYHGSGPKAAEWAGGIKMCQIFDDGPSAYFIPQIPNESQYRWWQKSKQYAWEKLFRLSFLSGEIDPNRLYFFGISEGGYGSQRLASFYADYLAGAGPMAGGEPLRNAPVDNCRNIAFSFLTGALDHGFGRNELTQVTKDEFVKFQESDKKGFKHRIELLAGMGHGIDYRLTTPWLKAHTRNPRPNKVLWENFEMDGLYRTGFYNLYVLERSHEDHKSRARYMLDIKGNNIDLKVDLVDYEVTKHNKWGVETLYKKTYTPATKGKVLIYLHEDMVDLAKPVTVTVNGKKLFEGIVPLDMKHLVNSCAAFYDPERLFPAAIEVDIAEAAKK